jgi:hypothetical protein
VAANLIMPNGLIVVSGYYRYYDQDQGADLAAQGFLALDQPRHAAVRKLMQVTK